MTEIPILLLDTGQDGLSAHLPALRALGGGMDYLQVAEAQAALELLEQRRIGVVVADFGAATDDCVTFFQSAAARRPATIRIAVAATLADLTDGLAERGPHHCLSAGCSADQLHAVLLRCSAIWARIQRQPDLARMLAKLEGLAEVEVSPLGPLGMHAFLCNYLGPEAGERLAWLSENAVTGDHPYAAYLARHGDTVRGTLSARDGQAMHWQLTRPKNFDAGRRYPVIVLVYGGPTGQLVTDSWWRNILVEQFWVQRGYLVFTLDNRGIQHYGKAFQDPVYKRLGVVDVEGQLRGVEWLKRQDYVDDERIGMFGWSYGGYMALMALMQSPGTLAAGAAVAPVTDWALYDTHYTERYMGLPADEPEAYARTSVLEAAADLRGRLLVIHGTHDTRKIGRPSSDGCIGLYNDKIEELFALAPIGTQVRLI